MINFRYHIVSLMAVFLALSVGIVLGVTLRGPVGEGLVQSAAQDRNQVKQLRAELDRRNALDDYRDAYAQRSGKELTAGMLTEWRVAIIAMPDAPTTVVDALSTAVTDSGGVLTHTVKINKNVFDPAKKADVDEAMVRFSDTLALKDPMSSATKVGLAVGRSLLSKQMVQRDEVALNVGESLTSAGLISVGGRSTEQAELAIVVTAKASEPRPTVELLSAHIEMDVALKEHALGVVIAGPNSDSIDGTDVLTARNAASAVDSLSTVDVADLPSGVTTTIIAGKEQLLGNQGHYGALSKADAPLPQLPVR